MIVPIAISIVALITSMSSLAFSIYQWKKNSFIKISEKVHEVTLGAFELRQSSRDLRNLIAETDDIDDMEEFLQAIDSASQKLVNNVLRDPNISLSDIYAAQNQISDLGLELNLLHKQVLESKKFNDEVSEHNRSKNH